jgi:hypothetical protein
MSGVTGIELGPNYCVLVRGGRLGSHRTVSAASVFMPFRWPGVSHPLVDWLREARQRCDLSSRARVVAWGDRASLSPLVEAGFEIASVLSPAQALARVVRARQVNAPAGTAVAALSLNSHGAAIAIVAGVEVIQSRVFGWPLGTPFIDQWGDQWRDQPRDQRTDQRGDKQGGRSELLDRYLIVSQIAPQLQHVIDLVRPAYGVTVTSVVACGNLPNLRSLAMLLIEEMDIEVETLDSAELLDPSVAPGTLADTVASLQLAAAVASSDENRVPIHAETKPTPAAGHVRDEHTPGRVRPGALLQSLAALVALAFCSGWSLMQVFGSGPARPVFPEGIEHVVAAAARDPHGLGGQQEPGAEATTGRAGDTEPAQVPEAAPGSTPPGDAMEPSARPSPGRRVSPRASQNGVPLPSVDGIMIAGTHRLAIVGGTVVAAGDAIGPRAVARIERDGVVLRESSGREVYVAIRLRKPPTLGS